jgi:hypothetical protein
LAVKVKALALVYFITIYWCGKKAKHLQKFKWKTATTTKNKLGTDNSNSRINFLFLALLKIANVKFV